jgi:hypothetical protein
MCPHNCPSSLIVCTGVSGRIPLACGKCPGTAGAVRAAGLTAACAGAAGRHHRPRMRRAGLRAAAAPAGACPGCPHRRRPCVLLCGRARSHARQRRWVPLPPARSWPPLPTLLRPRCTRGAALPSSSRLPCALTRACVRAGRWRAWRCCRCWAGRVRIRSCPSRHAVTPSPPRALGADVWSLQHLLAAVRAALAGTGLCAAGRWTEGSELLALCRACLSAHPEAAGDVRPTNHPRARVWLTRGH